MDDTGGIEVVVILTHANNNYFVTDSTLDAKNTRRTAQKMYREDIIKLEDKNIDAMYLLGCNMGLSDPQNYSEDEEYRNSLASTFYAEENPHNIGMIIAADGSIEHGISSEGRIMYTVNADENSYHDVREHDGFKKYYMEDSICKVETITDIEEYMGKLNNQNSNDDCVGVKGKKEYGKKK